MTFSCLFLNNLQEHLGLADECSCERRALAHAAGKLVWIRMLEAFQTDHFDKFVYAVLFLLVDAAGAQTERNVIVNRQPREQRVLLKHEAAVCAGGFDGCVVERFGIVCEGDERLNPAQQEMAKVTNREHMTGTLADAVKGADVFFGMSAPQVLTAEMVSTMAQDPMVFAMANPVPEIWPEDAKKGGAAVVGTGRSDYPNQINNVLAFPGIFRGALDVRASDINEEMKLAAAKAIAACVSDEELNAEYIMPMAFDKKVIRSVADAVAQAARDSGVARI